MKKDTKSTSAYINNNWKRTLLKSTKSASAYINNNWKPVKCKGYTKYNKHLHNEKQAYKEAKIPIESGWTEDGFQHSSLDDCEKWVKQRGWIAWLVPSNLIAIDVESEKAIKQIFDMLEKQKIKEKTGIHKSKNGYHFIFSNPDNITGGSQVDVRLGITVTYKLGGKGLLTLEPMPERKWVNFVKSDELAPLPEELKPKKKNKPKMNTYEANGIDEPTSFKIALESGYFYQNNGYIRPYDNSGVAEHFGHSKEHNKQAYILPANNPDRIALVIGGSEHTLSELAGFLGVDLHTEKAKKQKKKKQKKETKPSFSVLLDWLTPKLNWICFENNNNIFVYKKHETGYYSILTKERQNFEIRKIFPNLTPSQVGNLRVATTQQAHRYIDDNKVFIDSMRNGIPFLNGVFNLKSGKLRNYTDKDYFINPIKYNYKENPNNDGIIWFLNRVSEWVGEDNAEHFTKLLAYFLFIYPNREQIWLNFYGEGQNGKGLSIWLLETILSNENCIGVDLQQINRFTTSTFENKRLIVGRDSSHYVSKEGINIIKTLSGDDTILIERKGFQPYDATVTAKLIVSTNNFIRSADKSKAWYRRIITVPFPNTFNKNEKIKDEFKERIPDIVSFLACLAYEYKQEDILLSENLPKDFMTLKTELKHDNNPVLKWYDEEIKDTDLKQYDGMLLKDFHNMYANWYREQYGTDRVKPALNHFSRKTYLLNTEFKDKFIIDRPHQGNTINLKNKDN